MRGCQPCVHTLPWFRMYGHIGGTLPRVVATMFPYTWTHPRLPPMYPYFHCHDQLLRIFPYTWRHARLPPMCPYIALAPKAWTHKWHIARAVATHVCIHMVTCAVAAYVFFASPYRCVECVALRCVVLHSIALRYMERERDIGFASPYRGVECADVVALSRVVLSCVVLSCCVVLTCVELY